MRSIILGSVLSALCVASASPASAQLGTNYCAANPNSTGSPAAMSASGTTLVVLNDLTLGCSSLPPGSLGYFLVSRFQGFVGMPAGSSGNLCLGAPIGRYAGTVLSAGMAGFVSLPVDLTQVPNASATFAVAPGDTLNFQYWHRDSASGGGATSNFSDGLEVTFRATPNVPGMVSVLPGVFSMGSTAPGGPPYYGMGPEFPAHYVTITYPFWIGQHEVTQAEYQSLMGSNPSGFPGVSRPVDSVSWYQARTYCAALTAQQATLGNVPPGYEYRLPTEAEWEYSCRAGTITEFHFGSSLVCSQARFSYSDHSTSSCSSTSTVPVGSYAPNAFGLYDMHGNVWEWCLDSAALYTAAPAIDPFVTGGPDKIIRGGSWDRPSSVCRSATRYAETPIAILSEVAFRVVLGPILVP